MLYESTSDPLTILSTLPSASLGAQLRFRLQADIVLLFFWVVLPIAKSAY